LNRGGIFRLLAAFCILTVIAVIVVTTGCGSGSNSQVRVMNAAAGESSVNVTLGSTTLVTGLGYGAATSYTSVSSGSPTLEIVPTGGTTTLIDEALSLTSGTSYTLLMDGYSTDVGLTTLTDDNTAPTSGNMNLRIVNAAPGLGTVDAYVVSPGTNLNTVTASVSSLTLDSASSYLSLAAGSYEIYFTQSGSKTAIIDSGSQTFAAGEVRTVVGLNGENGNYIDSILSDLN
jgi:hypothetical protein